jgi:hypothetical protein
MRISQIAIVIAFAASASPSISQERPIALERYRITLKGGGLGIDVDQTVVVSIMRNDERQHWVAEQVKRNRNWCGDKENGRCVSTDKFLHAWLDGSSCPALSAALQELTQIKLAGFAPPARSKFDWISETPLLTVSGTPDQLTGDGTKLSLSALTGPTVDWWARSEHQLSRCWSDTLIINGQQLESSIDRK